MAKEFYALTILLIVLFSCQNETKIKEKKPVQKKENLLQQIVRDSNSFIKNETASINKKGLDLVKQGDFVKAKKEFIRSLELEPKNAVTYNNLALIAANEGKIDQAFEYFKKAIYFDSSYYPAYINYSSLLVENDYFKRAIPINNFLLKMNQNNEIAFLANYFNCYAYLKSLECELAYENLQNAKKLVRFNQELENSLVQFEKEIKTCLDK